MKKIIFLFLLISSVSFGQVPSYVPTDSLVGWWGFNGNANDESGNGYNGTVNGPVLTTDRFNNANSAYDFDGNDLIDINSLFDYQERTTNIWITNTDPNWGNVTRLAFDNDNINMNFGLVQCGSGIGFPDSIGMGQGDKSKRNFGVLDTWYMCSIIRDADSVRFYFNGVLTSTQAVGTAASVINYIPTRIGGRVDNSRFWIGKIDDIGIWNRALDSCEIQGLYNSNAQACCSTTTGTDTQSACDSYTWIDGNTYTANNNTATYTLTNAAGCDSVVTLDLTINSVTVDAGNDQTVCLGCADIPDDSIALSASGAQTYAWNNGVTNGVYFTPTSTAVYTVTGTDANGCTDTDNVVVIVGARSCMAISISGLDSASYANQTYYQSGLDTIYHTNASGCDSIEYLDIIINHTGINENILKDVEVYPNPTSDIITLKGINSLKDVSYIHLLDNKGALLKKIGINETQVDLSSFSTGIYFIEIKHQLGSGRIKILIK